VPLAVEHLVVRDENLAAAAGGNARLDPLALSAPDEAAAVVASVRNQG
jgi:hypothetical protein